MEKKNSEVISIVLDVGPDALRVVKGFLFVIHNLERLGLIEMPILPWGAYFNWPIHILSTKNIASGRPPAAMYEHIIDSIRRIDVSSKSGNCLDDVMEAMDQVETLFQGREEMFDSKKLLLLTDFGRKYSIDRIDDVVAGIKKSGTKLFVIGLNKDKTSQQCEGKDVIDKMLEKVNGSFYSFSEKKCEEGYHSSPNVLLSETEKFTGLDTVTCCTLIRISEFIIDCEESKQVETSLPSETIISLRIDSQDVQMTCKKLEEELAAGPDDARAINIVDAIIEQGDEKVKTWMMWHLSDLLSNEMASAEKNQHFEIWPGTDDSSGKITLVCRYEKELETKLERFYKLDIFYNSIDSSQRDIDFIRPENSEWPEPTEEDATLIQSAIQEHGDRLFKQHSNLQVICGGSFLLHERKKYVDKTITIVLYCHAKGIIPYGEKEFPTLLSFAGTDIKVDVREGCYLPATGPRDYNKTLLMGISIGNEDDDSWYGTLGPIVNHRHGLNTHGFITCAHVVRKEGTQIVQPSEAEAGREKTSDKNICGKVIKRVFHGGYKIHDESPATGVDAALVEIYGPRTVDLPPKFPQLSMPDLRELVDSVTPNRTNLQPARDLVSRERELLYNGGIKRLQESNELIGKLLIKYGRTTGFTIGKVDFIETMVKTHNKEICYSMWRNKTITMKGLYLINRKKSPFAEPGDSGAGIFMVDRDYKLTLIGLVIGTINGTCEYRCVATPIEYVLDALKVKQDELRCQ